jgi:hypothetical protein
MRTLFARSLGWILRVTLLIFVAAGTARADDAKLVAAGVVRIAINGYDTVAYFTDGKATKGSSAYEYAWDDARWQFASRAHRDMFMGDPEHYAPQFSGFCAGAIVRGDLVPANPEAWVIVGGKLYMVAGSPANVVDWKANEAENIRQGDKQWRAVKARQAAQNQ